MLQAPTIPTEDLDALVKQLGLLDPTDQATRKSPQAARLAALAGKRIGLLDNRKPNAALLLQELGALLIDQRALAGTAPVSKFIYSRPAASNLIDELAQCDAVITAIGDWGSCVSCSLHDAVTLEGRGVPSVVLCTTPFLNSAAAHARLLGRPDIRAVEVVHPLVSLNAAQVHERAESVLAAVVDRLLGRE